MYAVKCISPVNTGLNSLFDQYKKSELFYVLALWRASPRHSASSV